MDWIGPCRLHCHTDFIELLGSASVLEACKFRHISWGPYSAFSTTGASTRETGRLLVHPKIRYFYYEGRKSSIYLFSHLSFPYLMVLSCHLRDGSLPSTELFVFHEFVKRSCSSLDSLSLYGSVITPYDSLNRIFSYTHSITKLRLSPDEDRFPGEFLVKKNAKIYFHPYCGLFLRPRCDQIMSTMRPVFYCA